MDIQNRLVMALKEKKLKIATAESCTGGLLSKLITDVSGASDVFDFGAVTYSNFMKTRVLGVKKETLEKYGAVSRETAIEMANGIRYFSEADIGVSITGIAGPDSDSTDKPVGLVFIGISTIKKTEAFEIHNDFKENVRKNNRKESALKALEAAYATICDL
ncbi:MAG: CinA family protein [Candidatus Fimenecus sp.]